MSATATTGTSPAITDARACSPLDLAKYRSQLSRGFNPNLADILLRTDASQPPHCTDRIMRSPAAAAMASNAALVAAYRHCPGEPSNAEVDEKSKIGVDGGRA